jgi:hypothetical protein
MAGYVRRMDEAALPRRIMYVTPIGQWKTGRPKAHWRKEVGEDVRMMFRVVFRVILPCKMNVDRRFRGAYCLHHQG